MYIYPYECIFTLMKKLLFIFIVLIISACASKKDVVYYQDIKEDVRDIDPEFTKPNKIEPKDILRIRISALEGKSVLPFLFGSSTVSGGNRSSRSRNTSTNKARLNGYLVDPDGNINFPQLGKIRMAGKTTQEAERFLEDLLSDFIKDPTVAIRLVNFKAVVMGEVKSPQVVSTDENNLTLPEAIGRAGDLTINGRRDNVLLIREESGKRIYKRIDLTKSDWMDSPYYNLKQDDIIYVEPNRPAARRAGEIGGFSSLLSTLSVVLSIVTVFIAVK